MDSPSAGRPFRDALATLAAFNRTYEDLREMLIQMGDGRAASSTQATEWGEEEEFWEAAKSEGGGYFFFVPAPISLAASVGPTYFA